MEWEWPSYIYSPGTNEVYAPSAVRPAQYGVESYGATGNIVYGKLAGDIADPNYYFIIQPKVGDTGFVETEYGLKAEWSEALSELGVANPDP